MLVPALQQALAAGGGMAEDDVVAGLEVWQYSWAGDSYVLVTISHLTRTGTVERKQLLILRLHMWAPSLQRLHWIKSCWQKRAEVVMET